MTPEQPSKMQAGRQAALGARRAEQARLDGDEHAQWQERHDRAAADHKRHWLAKHGVQL